MATPAPLCTHIKVDGSRCGSPAVRGAEVCFHHSAIKTALGKVTPLEKVAYGAFTPIPFVFPEDRAAMQINYFLLLQALNEQRIEKRTADLMLRILRSMEKNLGKSGSLVSGSDAAAGAGAAGAGAGSADRSGEAAEAGGEGEGASVEEAVSRVITEVNAAAVGYPEYREISPLHPAGQRVLNLCCTPPKR